MKSQGGALKKSEHTILCFGRCSNMVNIAFKKNSKLCKVALCNCSHCQDDYILM